VTITEEIGDAERIAELERANRSLNQRLARASSRTEEIASAVHRAFADALTTRPALPAVKKPDRDRRTRRAEVALWHLTDWQLGKVTSTYSTEKAIERVGLYCDKAVELTEIQRSHHPVRGCVIALGGDMIENTNTFPGQVYEIDSPRFAPITNQLTTVVDLIEHVARRALGVYDWVQVIGEPGNHGRVGKPGEHNRYDNWDYLAYLFASQRLAGEKRFTFASETHWFQRIEIGAYRAMLIHGDEVKGFGGNLPMYALVRKGNAWKSGAAGWAFEDIYVGHYHNENESSLAAGGKVYMTGSTESDNPYAAEFVAASAKPSQRLHFIDPERGRVTSRHQIYL
jgi:hypothetical protein